MMPSVWLVAWLVVGALLSVSAAAQSTSNVISIQFSPYTSGPLDPSEEDQLDDLTLNMNVYLYPTTYTQHTLELAMPNFTVLCSSTRVCTASAIVAFTGPNRTAEFNVIAQLTPQGFAALAYDINVFAVALGTALYGTMVPSNTPDDDATKVIVYAVVIPASVLVGGLLVWGLIRCYIKRQRRREAAGEMDLVEKESRSSDMGEELLSSEHLTA